MNSRVSHPASCIAAFVVRPLSWQSPMIRGLHFQRRIIPFNSYPSGPFPELSKCCGDPFWLMTMISSKFMSLRASQHSDAFSDTHAISPAAAKCLDCSGHRLLRIYPRHIKSTSLEGWCNPREMAWICSHNWPFHKTPKILMLLCPSLWIPQILESVPQMVVRRASICFMP
jgi:hypothetical protein